MVWVSDGLLAAAWLAPEMGLAPPPLVVLVVFYRRMIIQEGASAWQLEAEQTYCIHYRLPLFARSEARGTWGQLLVVAVPAGAADSVPGLPPPETRATKAC